jgi:uncharacterized membrane protein
MTMLIIGIVIWSLIHFIPTAANDIRASLVESIGPSVYKIVFVLVSIGSLMFVIVGWNVASIEPLYTLPQWGPYVTIAFMLVAFVMIFAPYLENSISHFVRHPQLLGVALWGVGHLFYNGEARSVVLFGGFAIWALVQTLLLNRRDGPWERPDLASFAFNVRLLLTGAGFYAMFMYTHEWIFGVGPVPHF